MSTDELFKGMDIEPSPMTKEQLEFHLTKLERELKHCKVWLQQDIICDEIKLTKKKIEDYGKEL